MQRFRPMLARHELTEQQWRVLRVLAASPEPLAVGTVADRTFLLGPSLSRILANLERRTLVERHRVEVDQRRAEIALSPSGRSLVSTVAPESEAIYAEIERSYGLAELGRLLDDLERLTTQVAKREPVTPDQEQRAS